MTSYIETTVTVDNDVTFLITPLGDRETLVTGLLAEKAFSVKVEGLGALEVVDAIVRLEAKLKGQPEPEV